MYVTLTIGQRNQRGSRKCIIIIAQQNLRGSGVCYPHHCRTELTWLRGNLPTSLPIRTHMTDGLETHIIAQP